MSELRLKGEGHWQAEGIGWERPEGNWRTQGLGQREEEQARPLSVLSQRAAGPEVFPHRVPWLCLPLGRS